jgi:hypothetical protein
MEVSVEQAVAKARLTILQYRLERILARKPMEAQTQNQRLTQNQHLNLSLTQNQHLNLSLTQNQHLNLSLSRNQKLQNLITRRFL